MKYKFFEWTSMCIILMFPIICRTLLAVKNHPLETHGFMSAIWSFLEIFVGSLSSGSFYALSYILLVYLKPSPVADPPKFEAKSCC